MCSSGTFVQLGTVRLLYTLQTIIKLTLKRLHGGLLGRVWELSITFTLKKKKKCWGLGALESGARSGEMGPPAWLASAAPGGAAPRVADARGGG